VAKGSYLGGSTIVRVNVYGPEPKRATPPKSRRKTQDDIAWLAANKRSKRKKRIEMSSPVEAEYKKAAKRRRIKVK
jgi:hypothetical protein